MCAALADLHVLGVHPIETQAIQGDLLQQRGEVYLVEIKLEPSDAIMDWSSITQSIAGEYRSNWQVPYDEQVVDAAEGTWAFFFHFLDLTRPLLTPVGERELQTVTSVPPHLAGIVCDAP